jgi:hypothetical protein
MSKLYEVHLKYYVLAEDEQDAEISPLDFDMDACTKEIHEAESVDSSWWDSPPFVPHPNPEDDEDKTCGEIFTESKKC